MTKKLLQLFMSLVVYAVSIPSTHNFSIGERAFAAKKEKSKKKKKKVKKVKKATPVTSAKRNMSPNPKGAPDAAG